MKNFAIAASMLGILAAGSAGAVEGTVPTGVPKLDHVFVIMMENHAYGQVTSNPDTPYINSLLKKGNVATNYYGVAHPSSTNYLEIVGGSNFNNLSDQYPDWHNKKCTPNIKSGITNVDVQQSSFKSVVGPVCPIQGTGTDAPTPAVDNTNNEGTPPLVNLDGSHSYSAETNISGKTIADQLVAAGLSWKSYQEGLPINGSDGVNVSDGFYTLGGPNAAGVNVSTDFKALAIKGNPVSDADVVYLYAVKHDPFAYFASVQNAPATSAMGLGRIVPFYGLGGLFGDLRKDTLPSLAFIAPNQCDDQHGRGNGTAFCNYDSDDNGTQTGLNPSLMRQGDLMVERLVTSIQGAPVWSDSKSAIVLVWDENDYSTHTPNKVVFVVLKNYGVSGTSSAFFYDHYSLTKTLDGTFGLPCLNHACDAGTRIIADLFR